MSDDLTRRKFLGTAAAIVLVPVDAHRVSQETAADRRILRAAVDRIIPAQGKMPAASSIGAVAYIVSVTSRHRDLRERVENVAAALGAGFGDRPEAAQIGALAQMEKTDPLSFGTLRDLVYEAYYTSPRVWALIGYEFRAGSRKTARLEDFNPALLARVKQLPPLYRDAE